jgi:hypothetical protein
MKVKRSLIVQNTASLPLYMFRTGAVEEMTELS